MRIVLACAAYVNRNECEPKPKYTWALRKEVVVKRKCHCNYNYYVDHYSTTSTTSTITDAAATYLQAGSPTSLKKTQVPPFKQNAFPITGHAEPECVQFICWLECPVKKGNKKRNCNFIENTRQLGMEQPIDNDRFEIRRYRGIWGKSWRTKLYLLVYSRAFGNTSILVNFLIGWRANLFFALHSYCPESLARADLIISSERRLEWK